MNEILKVIESRRSIRNYKPDQVSEAELQQIIRAAILAPSARNQQCWHFSVIQKKEIIDELARVFRYNAMNSGEQRLAKYFGNEAYHVFFHAPTVIVVSRDPEAGFIDMDCGIAVQNMCLAAESMGIGSCIIGLSRIILYSEEGVDLMQDLGIPEGYSHICSVALGYPDGLKPEMPPRNTDVVNYVR
jgi:nitroreductase